MEEESKVGSCSREEERNSLGFAKTTHNFTNCFSIIVRQASKHGPIVSFGPAAQSPPPLPPPPPKSQLQFHHIRRKKKKNSRGEERKQLLWFNVMDLWNRARAFAEEAAKISQEISIEAAKKSQELILTKSIGAAKLSQEFVSGTTKKSKELAAEASKKAELIKIEALKSADKIKSFAGDIDIPRISIPIPISKIGGGSSTNVEVNEEELEKFGITEELKEFVKGIGISTFREFDTKHEPQVTDVPTVANVQQDLNEWQARHATLVLTNVGAISKLRYELCPRYMKERKFWWIYFNFVNCYVNLYENKYFEEKVKLAQQEKEVKDKETNSDASASNREAKDTKLEGKDSTLQTKTSTTSAAEQDLDVFLLGDLGSSDDDPGAKAFEYDSDARHDDFDEEFCKTEDKALDTDDDTEKTTL